MTTCNTASAEAAVAKSRYWLRQAARTKYSREGTATEYQRFIRLARKAALMRADMERHIAELYTRLAAAEARKAAAGKGGA